MWLQGSGMGIGKKTIVAGLAVAGLAFVPVKPVAAYDYMSAYGMYQRNGLWYSSNYYINYIIQHESSGRPWVTNSLGCMGLMQMCPQTTVYGLTLGQACPDWRTNINCQL